MFSSKSFIVSRLTFRSLTYFEIIFVYGVRECSSFILLHELSSFSSRTYWRDCLFSIVYSCLLCHRLIGCRCMGLLLDFLFCSTDLWVCFSASTMLLWLLYLCSIVQNQGQWLLQFCSSFSRLFWLFMAFCIFIQILKLFILVLWKRPLLFWQELCEICRLPWVIQ